MKYMKNKQNGLLDSITSGTSFSKTAKSPLVHAKNALLKFSAIMNENKSFTW